MIRLSLPKRVMFFLAPCMTGHQQYFGGLGRPALPWSGGEMRCLIKTLEGHFEIIKTSQISDSGEKMLLERTQMQFALH
jgi:hypothetical protein